MRILYLDDSGKVHANNTDSKVAAFGGFSVDEGSWHRVVRKVAGLKAATFPNRGKPDDWEVHSDDFLTLNNWQRAKKRRFCYELAHVLATNGCNVYAVTLEKAKAKDPLDEAKFVPMMLHRLGSV